MLFTLVIKRKHINEDNIILYKIISKIIFLVLMKRGPESYNSLVGVYNGSSFDFVGDKSPVVNIMKVVWRYGFNAKRLQNFVSQFLSRIDK